MILNWEMPGPKNISRYAYMTKTANLKVSGHCGRTLTYKTRVGDPYTRRAGAYVPEAAHTYYYIISCGCHGNITHPNVTPVLLFDPYDDLMLPECIDCLASVSEMLVERLRMFKIEWTF